MLVNLFWVLVVSSCTSFMGRFFKLVFDIGCWLEGEKNEICTIHNQTYLVKHGRW